MVSTGEEAKKTKRRTDSNPYQGTEKENWTNDLCKLGNSTRPNEDLREENLQVRHRSTKTTWPLPRMVTP